MRNPDWFDAPRWELATALLIAVVSFTTALVVYLTNRAGSDAADESHQGLIEAIKLQAFANENWRETYQVAASAYTFTAFQDGAQALEASQDPDALALAENYRQFLLPNLQLLAEPLVTELQYQRSDGTYNLQKRFAALQDEPEIKALDPQARFDRAAKDYARQRWYVNGSVLLAASLFWLALAQVSHTRRRLLSVGAGLLFFAVGVVWVLSYGLFN